MNALIWMVTGIAIGWLSNTLSEDDSPSAMAFTMVFAAVGALFGGWMVAPVGTALALQQDHYSAAASLAALAGAGVLTASLRGLLHLLEAEEGMSATAAADGFGVQAQESSWRRSAPDAGPDTLPGGREITAAIDRPTGARRIE